MNKKYERYISYIVNDIEKPYLTNMKDNYGLKKGFCLRLVNKKSTVFPYLSTARYKYISLPFTLIYVSSIRQLSQTCFFRLCIFFYTSLENLNTHLWIVEWSTFIPLIDINSSTSL